MTDNPSLTPLADAATNVPAADGGGTVVQPALTLEQLNAQLGSTFKDVPSALKSLKDTKDFVGKRKEDIAAEVKASLIPANQPDMASKADIQALKEDLFYSQNKQYEPYKAMINRLGSPADVVNSPEFKDVFDKASKADEMAQAKSVVNSNSRLSQPSAPIIEQAVQIANSRGTTIEDVATVFAEAINKEARGE